MGVAALLVVWPGPFWTNFCSHVPRSLHMKLEFNWPSGFRVVWKCWWTDGRQSDWYTICSPMCLWLRWAKNQEYHQTLCQKFGLKIDLKFYQAWGAICFKCYQLEIWNFHKCQNSNFFIWFFTSKSTIFQLRWNGSSWVEPVLSYD